MKALSALAVLILLAACAAPAPPPELQVNLSGYPPEFREGYADGCASARGRTVRNEKRMQGDVQYAAGWRDGNDICKRRN